MEHNFNPNKGDYKYILEEEQKRKREELSLLSTENKNVNPSGCFGNYIVLLLLNKFKKHNKIKLSAPVFWEMFC